MTQRRPARPPALPLLGALALVSAAGCARPAPVPAAQQADGQVAQAPADVPRVTPDQPLPLKLAPRPTGPAISVADLMTRIYVFADDSMLGREAGTEGNFRGTEYIAREARRLGLRPAGEGGSYFQALPFVARGVSPTATITAGGRTLAFGRDFLVQFVRSTPRPIDGAAVVYAGPTLEGLALTPAQVAGKVVVVGPRPASAGPFRAAVVPALAGAAGIVYAELDSRTAEERAALLRPSVTFRTGASRPWPEGPMVLYATRAAAEQLVGRPLDGLAPGAAGPTLRSTVAVVEQPAPARNVIAILPGSDPALRDEYVAIGAHNDHVGENARAVDHDSLRAFHQALMRLGAAHPFDAGAVPLAQRQAIRVNVDSLRRLRPARPDSINNGADDDGSGSMALLEIAEAMAALPEAQRPKRSILFVWHTGEEKGLLGSRWFTDHPTVPLDRVVAHVNIDMIGRGGAEDVQGGGPQYLSLVGSRRLSTELGDLVEAVNGQQPLPFRFDYGLDATGHPEQIYCRSDHANYARFGIPVVFFFTNLHADYHQVTDEPQYVDYDHYMRITRFIHDVVARVASLDRRVAVDKPKPDPNGSCQQ